MKMSRNCDINTWILWLQYIMSIDFVCVLYCVLLPFVNARTGWVDQGWKEPVHKASSHWQEKQARALRSGWPNVFGTRNLANGTGCTKIRQGNSWSIARQIHVLKLWSVRFQKDSVCQKESNFVSEKLLLDVYMCSWKEKILKLSLFCY